MRRTVLALLNVTCSPGSSRTSTDPKSKSCNMSTVFHEPSGILNRGSCGTSTLGDFSCAGIAHRSFHARSCSYSTTGGLFLGTLADAFVVQDDDQSARASALVFRHF